MNIGDTYFLANIQLFRGNYVDNIWEYTQEGGAPVHQQPWFKTWLNIHNILWKICGDISNQLPSSNQSWLAGKFTIQLADFPTYKPLFSSEISQPATFDDQRVNTQVG